MENHYTSSGIKGKRLQIKSKYSTKINCAIVFPMLLLEKTG